MADELTELQIEVEALRKWRREMEAVISLWRTNGLEPLMTQSLFAATGGNNGDSSQAARLNHTH